MLLSRGRAEQRGKLTIANVRLPIHLRSGPSFDREIGNWKLAIGNREAAQLNACGCTAGQSSLSRS